VRTMTVKVSPSNHNQNPVIAAAAAAIRGKIRQPIFLLAGNRHVFDFIYFSGKTSTYLPSVPERFKDQLPMDYFSRIELAGIPNWFFKQNKEKYGENEPNDANFEGVDENKSNLTHMVILFS